LHSSTKPAAKPDAARLPFTVPASEQADFRWLMSHTSVEEESHEYPSASGQ